MLEVEKTKISEISGLLGQINSEIGISIDFPLDCLFRFRSRVPTFISRETSFQASWDVPRTYSRRLVAGPRRNRSLLDDLGNYVIFLSLSLVFQRNAEMCKLVVVYIFL